MSLRISQSHENIELSKEITRSSKIMDIRSNNYEIEHRTRVEWFQILSNRIFRIWGRDKLLVLK